MWWYNFGVRCYSGAIRLVSPFNRKAKLWSKGRKRIFDGLRDAMSSGADVPVVWVHCASLGEFEQGRPVIEAIKRTCPEYKILLTFFSPSGYEIRKNYEGADWVFYLPTDTVANAARFIDIVNPQIAVFIKYEFWLNYLTQLRKRNVRTFVVSAVFRRDSIFFKPYGKRFRNALATFEKIFVQDDNSRSLLEELSFRDNVVVAGDTRFDRVADIAKVAKKIPEIERFINGAQTFVAGSTWEPDEELLQGLINRNPDVKFIVAPHEMNKDRIETLMKNTRGGAVRYTDYVESGNGGDAQLLVIDTIGILSSVYRYARYGYIGGGFGAGIHNTLEAVTYGLPIAFGTNYRKFREATELIELGVAKSIDGESELEAWFTQLKTDSALYGSLHRSALSYISSHTGATDMIVKSVFGDN